jgi:hypothetical protein
MRRSIMGAVAGRFRRAGVLAAATILAAAAVLAVAVLTVAGCGSTSSPPAGSSASPSSSAGGPAGTFSDPAHAFSLKYDDTALSKATPADAAWIAQFDKALGSGGKTTFVVAFHRPVQGTAGPASGQVPIPVQAVGVTRSNLSADGYKEFVSPKTLRTYAKQIHAQDRKYYGPSTQTQITKVAGYPAISSASYGKDKVGRSELVWSVTVFTPKWHYLFYTVADAATARQSLPAFDAVLRSLRVTK